jgi:hypothetical protein
VTLDRRMSLTTRIYIGLVVAAAIYVLGAVVFLEDADSGPPQTAPTSFLSR